MVSNVRCLRLVVPHPKAVPRELALRQRAKKSYPVVRVAHAEDSEEGQPPEGDADGCDEHQQRLGDLQVGEVQEGDDDAECEVGEDYV